MTIFKGKFKYINFVTLGLIFDITGVLFLALAYKSSFLNPYGWQNTKLGKLHFLLEPPELVNKVFFSSVILIIMGFLLLLIGEIQNIKKRSKKIIISKISIILLIILYFILLLYSLFWSFGIIITAKLI